jgi:protein glucosyltransferase
MLICTTQLRILDLGNPYECYVSNGRERIMATLNLIQRALSSTPADEPVPNIEFPISYDDMPTRSTQGVTWGFTRKQDQQNVWLVPDYGYWSWWAVGIPSFKSVWRQMEVLESNLNWQRKIPRAVWRGTTHYNQAIRDKLVETARDTTWGDVKVVSHGESDDNFLTLDAHCR